MSIAEEVATTDFLVYALDTITQKEETMCRIAQILR